MAEEWKSAAGWAAEAKAIGVAPKVMPGSTQGVIDKANRENWPYRDRADSGGGREYLLSDLPPAFRQALTDDRKAKKFAILAQHAADLEATTPLMSATAITAATRQHQHVSPIAPAEGKGAERRDVRLSIINLYALWLLQSNTPDGSTGRLRFADLYNSAQDVGDGQSFEAGLEVAGRRYFLAVPAWVLKAKPHVSPASIFNWQKLAKNAQGEALGGRYAKRKSALDMSARVRDAILGSVLKGRDISMNQMRDEIVAEFGEKVEIITDDGEVLQRDVPSAGQIGRWINAWKIENADFLLHSINPDKWKSKNRIAIGDLYGWVERPNQLWEIDASPADLLLLEDDGRTSGRYTLYVLIDIFTRRIMVLVTKTAATAGALLLLKKGIEAWGKPEMVRTDQGSDFISQEARRFFGLLNIIHDDCTAYSPEQKAGVERHVKTVQHGIINLLPGFIGHSVSERQKIEAVKAFSGRLGQSEREAFAITMTRDDLQATLNDWTEFKYAHSPHGGLKGETPFNKAVRWPGKLVRIGDPERLAMLLSPVPKNGSKGAGIRTVTKKGVQVEEAHFYAKALLLFMGKDVFVRMDPEDMGQVWVFKADHSEFICKATNIERLGVGRAAAAAEAKAHQNERMKELRAEGRRLKAACKPHKFVKRMLLKAKTDNSSVIHIGDRQSIPFSNPALDAIGVAMRSGQPIQASPVSEGQQEKIDALAVELSRPKAEVVTLSPKGAQVRRALEIERRLVGGLDVDERDRTWLASFKRSATYQSFQLMAKDFGVEEALASAM